MLHGQKWFSFLTEELPAYIRHTFPSSPKREDNFIMGFSMGGHGAVKAALRCPDKYGYAVAIGGAADMEEMLGTLGGDSDLADRVFRMLSARSIRLKAAKTICVILPPSV
jgi:S-formylglutathione hydrolase FrmB